MRLINVETIDQVKIVIYDEKYDYILEFERLDQNKFKLKYSATNDQKVCPKGELIECKNCSYNEQCDKAIDHCTENELIEYINTAISEGDEININNELIKKSKSKK